MNLDVKTLFMVITLGYFTGAVILAILSISVRSIPKPIRSGWGLWSICLALCGLGVFLIGQRGGIPDLLSILLANALLTTGFGLTPFATALLNNKKRNNYLFLPMVGTLGWLGLYAIEFFREDTFLRVVYVNVFCLISILLCLRESWLLDRKQISSWFMISAFSLDAIVRFSFIVPHLDQEFTSLLASYETLSLQICMLILIATIVIKVVGVSVSIFEMQRQQFREEAEKDPTTGLYNQRGFYRATEARIGEDGETAMPFSLVLMEIDDLRSVEKRFGPSMTDALLKLFAEVSRVTAPQEAITGVDRNGQIALYLPQSDQIAAVSYARRISKALMTESKSASGAQFSTTLSAGVFAGTTETPLKRALEVAGHSLRQAQKNGGKSILVNDNNQNKPVSPENLETPFARRQKDTELSPV